MLATLTAAIVISGTAYVVDGDTVGIGGYRFRLQGVDAPELSMPYGGAAKREMADIVGRSIVICTPNGERTYDRLVAVCTVNGQDIGRVLISRGLALDCPHFSGGRYRGDEPPGVRGRLTPAPYCGRR